MEKLLADLYAWYREHDPESIRYTFPPPAPMEEIGAAEKAIGIPFPEDLRALYLRHMFMVDVWGSITISRPSEIASSHEQLLRLAGDMAAEHEEAAAEIPDIEPMLRPLGPVAPLIHTRSRIPFAADNDRDILIDMNPPEGGKPGQIIRLDIECGEIEVIAGDLRRFFEQGLEYRRAQNQQKRGLGSRIRALFSK